MKEQVFQFSTGRMLFIGPCMPIKLKINKYIFGCFEKHALASSISTSYQCKRWQNPPVMRFHLVLNSRKHLITAVCVCSAQSDDCVESDTRISGRHLIWSFAPFFYGFLSLWWSRPAMHHSQSWYNFTPPGGGKVWPLPGSFGQDSTPNMNRVQLEENINSE